MEYPEIPSFPITEDTGMLTGFHEYSEKWGILSTKIPPQIPDDYVFVGVLDFKKQIFIFWTKEYTKMKFTLFGLKNFFYIFQKFISV